jgi:hypothetical protein
LSSSSELERAAVQAVCTACWWGECSELLVAACRTQMRLMLHCALAAVACVLLVVSADAVRQRRTAAGRWGLDPEDLGLTLPRGFSRLAADRSHVGADAAATMYDLDGSVFDGEVDPLEQVIDFIKWQEWEHYNKSATTNGAAGADRERKAGTTTAAEDREDGRGDELRDSNASSFLETAVDAGTGVGKVHAFCEICILVMQMKERGQPHLCAGLNPDYFISCVENLESLLRADKAVVYWLRSGCMHLDREGPEIVRYVVCVGVCIC